MRTSLILASAGATFLGLAAPAFAQPATTATKTGPGYNTSGPAADNGSNPNARPLSGYGTPPASSRNHPADNASSHEPATTRTTTGPGFNTSGAAAANGTRTLTSPSGQNYPGPNQKTAAESQHGVSANTAGTAPSMSHPQYNTAGPAQTNAARPGNPPAPYYSGTNGKP